MNYCHPSPSMCDRIALYTRTTCISWSGHNSVSFIKGSLTYMPGGCVKVAFHCKSIGAAASDDDRWLISLAKPIG